MSDLQGDVQDLAQNDGLTDETLAFSSVRERFEALCSLLKGLASRYIRVHSTRLLDEKGNRSGGVSTRELMHIAGIQEDISGDAWLDAQQFPSFQEISVQLWRFRAVLERRIEASYHLERAEFLVPEALQAQFQLSSAEILLLCAVAAPQIDADICRMYQFASGLNSTIFPGWFYADLLADDEISSTDILALLEPSRALRMYALLEAGRQTDWGSLTPVLQAPLSVPNRIASSLVGIQTDNAIEYAEIWHPNGEMPELMFESGFKKQIFRLFRRVKPRLMMLGTDGFGRRSLARQYAASQNQCTLEIDFCQITPDESPSRLLALAGLWFREARLCNAVMIFRCGSVSSEVRALLEQISGRFRQMLEPHPGAVVMIAERADHLLKKLFGNETEIYCQTPPRSMQHALWCKALEPFLEADACEQTADYIASSYCLTMGEIQKTIQATRARLASDEITGPDLAETLRTSRGQALEGLADLKATNLGLDDIVLSHEARKTIQEILNYARYSETVTRDWGFSRVSAATGLSVLFSGPPGTGKTLTAGVLAHELRRALYVVDISRVVDKYIGETEKRLAKIFDHAQASQAILLFDEADSLFAKRTNVKSSNDRYANLEVNYLLQRLEAYQGVCILTTNLADSLDEALARRIQFKIAFPMPDIPARAQLWEFLLPRKARQDDIDFMRLAEGFEMSGGHIKNAVFRACIAAASSQKQVDTEMLWDAGVHEYREMGHVIRDIDEDERYEESW